MKHPLLGFVWITALLVAPVMNASALEPDRHHCLDPDPDLYCWIEFSPSPFRAVLNPEGIVIPDDKQGEVDPKPASWARFNIRLNDAPPDLLAKRQEGGPYHDQFGGTWTVQRLRLQAASNNDSAACEWRIPLAKDHVDCYFLVPDFPGYLTDDAYSNEMARITGTMSPEQKKRFDGRRASVLARIRDQPEFERRLAQSGHRLDERKRLAEAIRHQANPAAVREWKKISSDEQDACRHRVVGQPGSWQVLLELPKRGAPPERIASVPGAILEAAGFALLPQDPTGDHSRILDTKDAETSGMPNYVVDFAFGEGLMGALQDSMDAERLKAEAHDQKARDAAATAGSHLPQ